MAASASSVAKAALPKRSKETKTRFRFEGRFYEEEYPSPRDIVVGQVTSIGKMGVYVTLVEYDGKAGMMVDKELSVFRLKDKQKYIKVGRTYVSMAMTVDKQKNFLDLSKRSVSTVDKAAKLEAFHKAKEVHRMMMRIASLNNIKVDDMCSKVSWPLHKRYAAEGGAYEACRRHHLGETNMWGELDFVSAPGQNLSSAAIIKLQADIEAYLRDKLFHEVLRLRCKVAVFCPEEEGIEAVREALTRGLTASRESGELKVALVSHPVFLVTCTCRDQGVGMEVLKDFFTLVSDSISLAGGYFRIRQRPFVMGRDYDGEGDSDDDDDDDDDGESEVSLELVEEEVRDDSSGSGGDTDADGDT